jgi:methyl-accepting chemotaxis protein
MSDKTKRAIGGILAGLVILTAVGTWVEDVYNRTLAQTVQAVRDADHVAARAIVVAQSALEVARLERVRADSIEADAAKDMKAANAALKRASEAKGAYRAAVAIAPDTCSRVVAAADSTIVALEETVEHLERSNEKLEVANKGLRTANDTLTAGIEKQQEALNTLRAAATNLANSTRPSFFSRLLPKTGFGVGIGVDITGRPTAVVGVTVGWRL